MHTINDYIANTVSVPRRTEGLSEPRMDIQHTLFVGTLESIHTWVLLYEIVYTHFYGLFSPFSSST